jgi:hypothetical protein
MEQILPIAGVEDLERSATQGLVGRRTARGGKTARDESLDAVADPGPGLGQTRPAEADRFEGKAEAMGKIRR